MFTVTWFKDAAERVLKSTLQAFLAALILSKSFGLDAVQAAAMAGIMAGLAAAKTVLGAFIPSDISPASWVSGKVSYLVDAGERLIFTFLEAFVTVLITSGNVEGIHLSTVRAAAMAGVAAGLSFVTSLLSAGVPGISPVSLAPPARGTTKAV